MGNGHGGECDEGGRPSSSPGAKKRGLAGGLLRAADTEYSGPATGGQNGRHAAKTSPESDDSGTDVKDEDDEECSEDSLDEQNDNENYENALAFTAKEILERPLRSCQL